jgi:hypothetical protein
MTLMYPEEVTAHPSGKRQRNMARADLQQIILKYPDVQRIIWVHRPGALSPQSG